MNLEKKTCETMHELNMITRKKIYDPKKAAEMPPK